MKKVVILLLIVCAFFDAHTQLLRIVSYSEPAALPLISTSAYAGISTGAASFGGVPEAHVLNYANNSRIAQTGQIKKIELYMASKPSELTDLLFTVWRLNGTTFDRVASQSILSAVTDGAGIKTITLASPISVQVGDFTGFAWIGSTDVPLFLTTVSSPSPGSFYTVVAPAATGYNWTTEAQATGYAPIQCYMSAPDAVFTGDSYVSGYPEYFPPADLMGYASNIGFSFPHKVASELDWTYQNMAIAGETTAEIQARFQKDVIEKRPKYAIINGGANDIQQGVSSTTMLANIESMIDACNANNIHAFYILTLPFSPTTDDQCRDIDSRNAAIITMCAAKGATVIDCRADVGEFRTGGDPANLWQLKAAYNSGDDVHLNNAGYTLLTGIIVAAVSAYLGN